MLKLILVSHFILSIATYCIILEKASSLLISALFYFFQIYRERLSSMNSRVIYNCYTWWIWSAKFIQIKNFLSLLFMNFHLKLKDSEMSFIANSLLKSIMSTISITTLQNHLQLQIQRKQKRIAGLGWVLFVALTIGRGNLWYLL